MNLLPILSNILGHLSISSVKKALLEPYAALVWTGCSSCLVPNWCSPRSQEVFSSCSCVGAPVSEIQIFYFLDLLLCFPRTRPLVASWERVLGRCICWGLACLQMCLFYSVTQAPWWQDLFLIHHVHLCQLLFSCLEYYLLPFHPSKSLSIFKVKFNCHLLLETFPNSLVLSDCFFLLTFMIPIICITPLAFILIIVIH